MRATLRRLTQIPSSHISLPDIFKTLEKESTLAARLNAIYNRPETRRAENALIIQGAKNIKLLLENNIRLTRLAITVPDAWIRRDQIHSPSLDVLDNPEKWPAEQYLANTIHCVRKIMGGQAAPGQHELWAEVAISDLPTSTDWATPTKVNRLLVMETIRNERDLGEIIRTARTLAWDAGIVVPEGGASDFFSPVALRSSRLQTLFFPMRSGSMKQALQQMETLGCTRILLRPLPESQIENSIVGVPHFWQENGVLVDQEELVGKSVALITSESEELPHFKDDIRLSIPVAPSPNSPYQTSTTIPILQATALAMMTLLQVTQGVKVGQPTGLKTSHPEEFEGNKITRKVAHLLNVPRPMSARQQYQYDKKKRKIDFARDWKAAEDNWEGSEPARKIGPELVPGKMGTRTPREW